MFKLKKLMKSRGFTLVELLIVIAIIGILAIAVLAALDPIEQLKKSKDTARLADTRELYSAYTRYYASYNCYPSEQSGTGCPVSLNTQYLLVASTASPINVEVSKMILNGELKAVFTGKDSYKNGELRVTQSADDSLAVCFTPESKSARMGGMGQVMNASSYGTPTCATSFTAGQWDVSCALCVR